MSTCIPYTYLVGWTKINKFYYGARYAQGCHPNDLWCSYFTSSTYVKEMRALYGEPDLIQVRKTFASAADALRWETKVLVKLKVEESDNWVNKRENRWPLKPNYFHSDETKEKIRQSKLGKKLGPQSAKHKQKISASAQNRSDDYRKKQKIAKLGKKWATDGSKSKLVDPDQLPTGWHWGRK